MASLFRTLKTLVTGKANEAVEYLEDQNIDTMLDQHKRDTDEELKKCKLSWAELDHLVKDEQRSVDSLTKILNDGKAAVAKLIEDGKEEAAQKLAIKLKEETKVDLEAAKQRLASATQQSIAVKAKIKQLEDKIKNFNQQAKNIKAQNRVNKITSRVNANVVADDTKSAQMQSALDRYSKKVQKDADIIESLEDSYSSEQADSIESMISSAGATDNTGKSAKDLLDDL